MGDVRTSLMDDIDLSGFEPRKDRPPRQNPAAIKEAAQQVGFNSREAPAPAPAIQGKSQRRHRTGRNVQFNIKARPEVIQAFIEIADANGWVLGEALEKAVEMLQKK